MMEKKYTPALGYQLLTPLCDLAVGLLTREQKWRCKLVELVAPKSGDRILDVGCGTGSLAIRLASLSPHIEVIGLDPDHQVLAIAHKKAERDKVDVTWMNGFLDVETAADIGNVSKIVSSLVFHQTAMDEKARIISVMRSLLGRGGVLIIADYGLQRTRLMRILFRRTVQTIDGIVDTQPNADGCLPDLLKAAGFKGVKERELVQTPTGSISIYSALAD